MKYYCKRAEDFRIADEFAPGDFKSVDIIFNEYGEKNPEIDQKFLNIFRFIKKPSDISEWINDLLTEPDDFFYCEEADQEARSIKNKLIQKGFIRTDEYERYAYLMAIVNAESIEDDVYEAINNLYDERYETIPPLTETGLAVFLNTARMHLTPSQYEIFNFVIKRSTTNYRYTSAEKEAFEAAIYNIKRLGLYSSD